MATVIDLLNATIDDLAQKKTIQKTLPHWISYQKAVALRCEGIPILKIDQSVIQAALRLMNGPPETVKAALPFLKMPHERFIIEYDTVAFRDHLTELGITVQKKELSGFDHPKAGFLVEGSLHPRGMQITFLDVIRDGQERVEVFPGTIHYTPDGHGIDGMPNKSKLANLAQAFVHLKSRILPGYHYDLLFEQRLMVQEAKSIIGDKKALAMTEEKLMRQIDQVALVVIPVIFLLNAKNALSRSEFAAAEALQKARKKRGKKPLCSYTTLVLNRAPHQSTKNGDQDEAYAGTTAVMGHLKVRKTGLFWWNPAIRRIRGTKRTTRKIRMNRQNEPDS